MEKPFVALKDPIQSGTGPDEAQELWAVTPDPGDGTRQAIWQHSNVSIYLSTET